tara:strand:+ start:4714 stop:5388 length:675 start_codon:yes stop_codon:yes gene_type:complete
MEKENKETFERLRAMEKEKEKYEIEIKNERFIIFPGVFSPKYFKSTEFQVGNIKVNKGEEVLEIGCGAGIFSIFAAKNASRVVATDINPSAVKNASENVSNYGLNHKVKVLMGDVYGPLSKDDKFDLIFWNIPFCYTESENIRLVEKLLFDPKYASIKRFFVEANKHLKKDGRLIFEFSSDLGKIDKIKKFIKESNLKHKLIKSKKVARFSDIISLELYEVRLK